MSLRKTVLCFSLVALTSGYFSIADAQDDTSLPDMPIIDESPPQEAPFTQPVNEFEEPAKQANDPATEVPVEKSPPVPPPTAAPRYPRVERDSAKKGTELIEHPLASKGLIRIEKDGSYIYQTQKGPHSESGILRFGSLQPPNIQSADKQTDFKSMYSSSNVPILLFDYEWQPFSSFGKLGMQIGFGFFTAQGSGRFLDGTAAQEKFTFIAVPLNVGFVYRMEFSDRQWLAPYIAGGGSYIPLVELRDDGKSPHGVGTPGAYGAGGLMFNVSSFDRETAFTLNSEYGIKNLWLALEGRYIKSFSQDLDLSAPVVNLGIAVDY